MARPLARIMDIDDTKELWKVAVKVTHRWNVISNNKEHFQMIFLDKDGCDIHVVVPTPYMAAYNEKFELDQTYTVSNFNVQPNNLLFKPTTHKFMVKFPGGTSVSDVNKHVIPPKQRGFTSFPDIIIGNFQKDVLIDMIGIIESVGYQQWQTDGKKLQVNFLLRDARNNTINCTLWEDYANQWFKFNEENSNTAAPTVVLLQYAKVKEQGQYPLSVTNTFHVTKLHINAYLPAIKDFVNSFPKDSLKTLSSHVSSQARSHSLTSTADTSGQTRTNKLLNKALTLPLSQIKKLREITFCATIAKTKKLIASSNGWYYWCCHECTKAARGDKPPFKYDVGHFTEAEIYKYKIEIEAVHLKSSCKFIFWDRECTDILNILVAQMRDTMIHAGIIDPLEFPLKLDEMLDLELAFRVKWQPGWDSCSVIMLIPDKAFVKQLKAPWEQNLVSNSEPSEPPLTLQIKESVDEAKTDVADDCDIVTDLEITSKHNSESLTPTTKIHIHDGSSESMTVDSLCDGELSSTKLKKIIKLDKRK